MKLDYKNENPIEGMDVPLNFRNYNIKDIYQIGKKGKFTQFLSKKTLL